MKNDSTIKDGIAVISDAKTGNTRTAIGRVRDHFYEIETALSRGVKLKAIWLLFEQADYEIPFNTFTSCLQRIRKERTANAVPEPITTSQATQAATGLTAAETEQAGAPFSGLSTKQKREKVADRYCPEGYEPRNPLLDDLIKPKEKK